MINCEVGENRTTPAGDTTRPTVDIDGVPGGCVRRAFMITTAAGDTGGLTSIGVRRDTQALATRQITDDTNTTLSVKVPAAALRSGRHQLAVTANDEAGNTQTVVKAFRRCARPRTKR